MANQQPLERSNHGDFWSQVPIVLFTVAAVVAIVVVNKHTQAAALQPSAPAPAIEIRLDPVGCADCGEVIAVHAFEAEDAENPGHGSVLLDVRMTDGSVRTIKQFSLDFDVGDRVQVNGNALVARG